MPETISDGFHLRLRQVVHEKLANAMSHLASGGALAFQDDRMSTAEKYAGQTMYIQALNDVLGWGEEVEAEMYGKPAAAAQQQGEAA